MITGITLIRVESPEEALCEICNGYGTWRTVDGEEEYFYCDHHAEELAKQCEEVQTCVNWLEG